MYGGEEKDKDTQDNTPWSVSAEFTIRRANNSSPVDTVSRSATVVPTTESSAVRMTYSFTPARAYPAASSDSPMAPSSGSYGFRRGNLMFTTTPPSRTLPIRSNTIPRTLYSKTVQHEQAQYPYSGRPKTSYTDSDYNSEQVHSQLLSSRQPSDKRCKSTCNIVLSPAATNSTRLSGGGSYQRQQPQSYLPCPRPWSSYYREHQAVQKQQQQHPPSSCCRFGTVPEVCEDCTDCNTSSGGGGGGPPSQFTTHFCTRLSEKTANNSPEISKVADTSRISKDAASQTTDIEGQNSPLATRRKVKKKVSGASSGSSGKDDPKNNSFGRLAKTPTTSIRSPTPPAELASDSSTTTTNTKDDNSEKRKRTVHIDVYCTGTDDDPNDVEEESSKSSSSNNEESENTSAQTTVFESKDVHITHTQAKGTTLPRGFQDEKAFLKRATERRCESFRHAPMRMPSLASSKGYESDDVVSSLYPSQFSSYSRLRDFESSVPWSAASSSVGIAADEYDSASATSWKDTVSDMESLIHSKSSITPCDSFDYADSLDRIRIKQMEAMLAKKLPAAGGRRNWRSLQLENNSLTRGGKLKTDRVDKIPAVGWSSESSISSSDSDDDSQEDVGWSFVSSEENTSIVQGKLILSPMNNSPGIVDRSIIDKTTTVAARLRTDPNVSQLDAVREVKTTIFRDRIGPFGSKSPSPPPSKLQSRRTSPFTTPQGERTDHILKASIFGRVVNTVRKPGHHIGPAKNPTCSCEHCRRYFEEVARGRSQSLDRLERRKS